MYSTTSAPPQPCSQGHISNLILPTIEGGSICLLCLSNLLSNPKSPTVHVSYALSQLSQALSQPLFLRTFLTFHSQFLISPLLSVVSTFDDEPIAKQTIDLIVNICEASNNHSEYNNQDLYKEFVARVSDRLSSGSLAWSRRQLYMLHCLGVLLDNQENSPYACIKDKDALVLNLITGLQLASEEIQGEIMFVLYKISLLQYTYMDDHCADVLFPRRPKLLHLSLEALVKTQSDDVRLNCVAFLTVLARRGFFQTACANPMGCTDSFEADDFMPTTDSMMDGSPLEVLFAEAVKGPLLSSDTQVQIATLDLILVYLSCDGGSGKEVQVLVEENLADYIFEILRLTGCKDPVINSSIQILDLLSSAEQAFRQRLAIGFTTLLSVLRYVSEIPFHPVQCQSVKLISNCVSNCPGTISTSQFEEISTILAMMFKKQVDGELGMLPETFTLSCSTFVALMKCSYSLGNSSLSASIRDALSSTISTCLTLNPEQILHSLYLLKEAYAYAHGDNLTNSTNAELRYCILDICKMQILPWFMTTINEIEEEDIALGVIETFHSILLQDSDIEAKNFTDILVSSSWFSVLFGCLGLFSTEKMKWRVYLMFSSIVDVLLGSDYGQPIRDAAPHLPSDPTDLLFLLGQKTSHNVELFCCQSAVLLVLYISSLYNDRIADDKLVLASLEQYILLNISEFLSGATASVTLELLVNLYGLYRGFAKMSYQIPYSPEAERIMFKILAENDWDSLSTRIHLTSLKWLFQQEKLCKSLSKQILKFCINNSIGNYIVPRGKTSQNVDLQVIAELIASGNSFGAMILVCLLGELMEDANREYDIISVVHAITKIIEIAPVASDQFCIYGIGGVLQNINYGSQYSFQEVFSSTTRLVFSILRSVHSESISNDEAWVGITIKSIDYMSSMVAADGWTEEGLIIIGTLSLILHHSMNQAMTEASKIILLSAPLVSTIDNTVSEACSKGPALLDHDEGTKTGEILIFVLSLLFFSLRSAQAILPGMVDFQNLLDEGCEIQPLSYVSIRCHDLCKLMHFGSPPVKLIASFCLRQLFNGISNHRSRKQVHLKFRIGYLSSMRAVLEGLIFFSDIRVSMNCSQCLSTLMTWKEVEIESIASEKNNWCRLIIEELVMSLSTPSMPSNSFMIHHKPAINIAVSLLKLERVPPWMNMVFDDSIILTVIQNISPNNVSTELVLLFRELLNTGYLKSEHIADLNRVFQACRRHVYTNEIQDTGAEEHKEKASVNLDDLGKARAFLIDLMSQSFPYVELWRSPSWKKQLLEEIELFSKSLMEDEIEG
ncbi:putative recombination initiation defect 1 [Forsythia ovata]|uniref:Recombination initiation defect 1 n=1 Tax=Forsythia ovata TaxID=205694 RepID=A0ABD1PHL3_9LAMI